MPSNNVEFRWMRSKNNKAPLLGYIKLCALFQNHQRIQGGFTVWKRSAQNWLELHSGNAKFAWKSAIVCLLWSWNLRDNLEKNTLCSSSILLQASVYCHRSIQTGVTAQKFEIQIKRRFFWSRVTSQVCQMTLKNKTALRLCYFKLCAFRSHLWIQTGVTVWKHPIQVKIGDLFVPCDLDGWPWKAMAHLFYTTSSFVRYFIGFFNSSWSYGPEAAKLGLDLCDLHLQTLTFTFCLDITSV